MKYEVVTAKICGHTANAVRRDDGGVAVFSSKYVAKKAARLLKSGDLKEGILQWCYPDQGRLEKTT